jgi:hypothetical protein
MNCHLDAQQIAPARRCLLVTLVAVALTLAPTIQAQTKSAPAAKKPAASAPPSASTSAKSDDPQLFRNDTVGFRYQIPYGWVDRTKDMQPDNKSAKSELLLAVFEHPPEATANTINSAVVIASESTSSYLGLKQAEDYLGPLTELATSKGFKVEGEPYALDIESRHLLRADFTKPLTGNPATAGTINDPSADTNAAKLTMHQCTLVLLAKGQIVSFTFIADSDESLDNLMDALHFTAPKSH